MIYRQGNINDLEQLKQLALKSSRKWTPRKIFRAVWAFGGIGFTIWLFYSFQAKGVDEANFQDSRGVTVEQNEDYISFTPTKDFKEIFIFYPGAMVDPKAYVPLCRKIADHDIKVLLMKMPWRLASKGYHKPIELNLFADTSKEYILAGHSQGAKMAAQFVFEHPGLIDKLILIGSTHPRDISLSGIMIPVMKIYGSKDGVADMETINRNKSKLPKTTKYILIRGANHSQFGYYGFQLGDHKADISRDQQQEETLKSILTFLIPDTTTFNKN
ncbi:alpha/beta hydrolase [Chitinophagaceae bacterium LB-8]|uniref:Alpha/beta hydrolase n=1 Tax=Paraflavisolibacter caeni TaxID=2982496 RepID=A0A9X2XNA0_9BACT|nr:alpha/beta hydrolase [Paraflavisolibacter caeni]MCU7548338.1 alpha/beta hydrolase [Paraflavisolibacter caeni]